MILSFIKDSSETSMSYPGKVRRIVENNQISFVERNHGSSWGLNSVLGFEF